MLDANSEHLQPLGEPCPSPIKYCQLAGAITESSKGHSTIPSSKLLCDSRAHGTSEFHENGSIAAFHLCELNSLDQK